MSTQLVIYHVYINKPITLIPISVTVSKISRYSHDSNAEVLNNFKFISRQ